MATFCTLRVPQNGIWQVTFKVTLANAPVDVTGWTAEMQLRKTKPSNIILADYTTSGGGFITLDGPSGSIFLDVPASVTVNYNFGYAVFDLYAGPNHVRVAEGKIIIDEAVTR